MGGEPTIHPYFSIFMEIAQKNFNVVSLFTNALSPSLNCFMPRTNDIITYNFRFSRILDEKKLLLNKPGIRNLEIQITTTTIKEKLVNEIIRVVSLEPNRVHPCLTLDCTANIFKYKKEIISIYEYVWNVCVKNGFMVGQDHLIPLCFLKGSKIPMPSKGSVCLLNCAGLIDSSYNLRFCNQYPQTLSPLFMPDGSLLPINSLLSALKNQHNIHLEEIKKKGCTNCSLFEIFCNGGCFVGKDVIKKVEKVL